MKRNTIQRGLVLEAVRELHNHPTAEQIYGYVAQKHPTISRGTVYRNLHQLSAAGCLMQVELAGAADCFDDTTAPHYHIQCRVCGRLFDVDMAYLGRLEQEVRDAHGFLIEGHTIVFKGVCPECNSIHTNLGGNKT